MEDSRTPTPREMAILKSLWELGPSSVRDVHRTLLRDESIGKELAYNTVQTLMRIMEEKGLIDHHLEGRSFIYTARFSRDESARRFLDRVFDGAASQFVSCLLRAESIPDEELDRMQAMIREARRARGGRS
jgi:BlaI family transcriptional regulator, penicillinase repressor